MRFLIFTFLIFSFVSCNTEGIEHDQQNQDQQIIEIKYAQHFNLKQNANGYSLEIIDPLTGTIESTHQIEQKKKYESISLSSTVVGMYAILHQQNLLKGISNIEYVYDPIVKKRFKSNEISAFGDETTHSIEKIISSKANTILYSGFGEEFPNQKKLEAMHFMVLPIYDWKEIDPLGKAEWIKVIGALTGKLNEATAFFNQVEIEYLRLKKLASSTQTKPSCISGNLIGDIWYTPASESYVARLMNDAGAAYRYSKTKGQVTLQFSIEQILKDNQETVYWINPGYDSKSKIDKFNPHVKHLKCYQNIYCYSPNMNKFWEQSAVEPHKVLSDLIHIFHPEIKEIGSFYYYAKID